MQPVACAGCQDLQRRLRDLQAENERLRRQLAEATRAGKRQAAPFGRGQPTGQPKRPGRKPGKDYGPRAHRQPPSPEQIDEVYEALLPHACPDFGARRRGWPCPRELPRRFACVPRPGTGECWPRPQSCPRSGRGARPRLARPSPAPPGWDRSTYPGRVGLTRWSG